MERDKHMIGFEWEERFNEAFRFLKEQCPNIEKFRVLGQLLDIIDPQLRNGLFERKKCKRKLKFIGESDHFFKKDEIYYSLDFNGGTYTITGYERLIGSSYFQIIDDKE